jgi:hypothetical protein
LFDRFYGAQLGAKAVELLVEGRNNAVSTLQYSSSKGFHVAGFDANRFRDRWGYIHARRMYPLLYDSKLMKPSRLGIDYLLLFSQTRLATTIWSIFGGPCSRPVILPSRITRLIPTSTSGSGSWKLKGKNESDPPRRIARFWSVNRGAHEGRIGMLPARKGE